VTAGGGRGGIDRVVHRADWLGLAALSGFVIIGLATKLPERPGMAFAAAAVALAAGPPDALIDRHGRRARIRWAWPRDGSPELLDELRRLDGVADVAVVDRHVEIRGNRVAIAHVGAALVRAGAVPDDLGVRIPTLEDALLTLLDGAEDEPLAPAALEPEPIGAGR
jgi:ABC-2 type transport system ATP-binding protein